MIRVTRRDFLKYCSVAAGALGLSASTLMKVENVLAADDNITDGGKVPDVVWISGAACTGCTMSLLNSIFYTTVDDLLINKIDLEFMDTVMATAGAYTDTEGSHCQYPGANSLKQAQDVYEKGELWATDKVNGRPFVLVIEGAIQTGKPQGAGKGDYCHIGKLTGLDTVEVLTDNIGEVDGETMLGNAYAFANSPGCVAILAVGTCASFGGIPGARGNVTGAKGVAFTGTRQGGAIVSNEVAGSIIKVIMTERGTGYDPDPLNAPDVTFLGGSSASATATVGMYAKMTAAGSGYGLVPPPDPGDVAPYVTFNGTPNPANPVSAKGYITINDTGAVTGITIYDQGDYTGTGTPPSTVTINAGDTGGSGATADLEYGVLSIEVDAGGSGYTNPDTTTVTIAASGGVGETTATAQAIVSVGGNVKTRFGLAAKVINISGCPPHPDWIVGTIAHILDTYLTLPGVNRDYQPVDYGYGTYQCNAGPCPWRYNNAANRPEHNGRYPEGNSRALGKNKYEGTDMGCLGILGCKGRKTKADCSRRRWNAEAAENYGVNWCVGSRGGCHGCTQPAYPDKVGKFFTFV